MENTRTSSNVRATFEQLKATFGRLSKRQFCSSDFRSILGKIRSAFSTLVLAGARPVSASNSSSSPEYSAEDEIRRREAVEAARMRLQERFNEDLKKYKEKKLEREKEEAMRRAEEWSLLQSGKSCSGFRRRVAEEDEDQTETDTKRRDKPKPRFRINDYNPLMGDTSGSRFRPSCRPTSGGG